MAMEGPQRICWLVQWDRECGGDLKQTLGWSFTIAFLSRDDVDGPIQDPSTGVEHHASWMVKLVKRNIFGQLLDGSRAAQPRDLIIT
jgi:hypothetical protein